MTAGDPCEGGCGCRLGTDDPAGRDDASGYPFEIMEARIPTYRAAHTPHRCRTIRRLRKAVQDAVPDAEVTVRCNRAGALIVMADVRDHTSQGVRTVGAVLSLLTIAYGREHLDWAIGAAVVGIVKALARPLDYPSSNVDLGRLIARDPYARRAP